MPTTILDGETYPEALHRRYAEEAKVEQKHIAASGKVILTTEQAQQIEEALVNLCNSIQLPTSDVKALATIRAARTQEFTAEQQDRFATAFDEAFAKAGLPQKQAEQEPVAYVVKSQGSVFSLVSSVSVAEEIVSMLRNDCPDTTFFALYAAPVRTKDLTPHEITALIREGAAGGGWQGFAQRVIAADRELNK